MSDIKNWGSGRSKPMHMSNDGVIRPCTSQSQATCPYRQQTDTAITSPETDIESGILAQTATWLHDQLDALPGDHPAIQDLRRRSISRSLPILGWCPSGRSLMNMLRSNGYDDLHILKSGLCDTKPGSIALQPFTSHALTILLSNINGRPERFWRRAYDTDQGRRKYSSSRITSYHDRNASDLFYTKEASAACRQHHEVIVMEGQFDVLATHAAGVKQTIAASGCTKFYQAELDACHRLSNNGRIVLCLDDDDAGLKGMLILGRRFPNEPFDVCLLPSGYDPCDLRSERGDQVLTQALHRRVPIADLIVQRGSYQDAIQAIHHLHGHDQDRLIALLSEKSGQSENRIREQVSNVKPSHVATQPAAYKEHRRWVKAMSVPPDNHQKAKSITDRAQSSESYNLLAQLAAASYREGTDISQYRRIMPAALFQEDHKDEVMALDEHQSIDDLIAKARKTIWRKLDL